MSFWIKEIGADVCHPKPRSLNGRSKHQTQEQIRLKLTLNNNGIIVNNVTLPHSLKGPKCKHKSPGIACECANVVSQLDIFWLTDRFIKKVSSNLVMFSYLFTDRFTKSASVFSSVFRLNSFFLYLMVLRIGTSLSLLFY